MVGHFSTLIHIPAVTPDNFGDVIANSDAESVAYDFIHPRIHGGRAFRPPMSWTSSFVSVWRSVFQM